MKASVNELANLIRMTHPEGVDSVITAVECGDNPDTEISALLSGLLSDDTFSEYTDEELEAAVLEMLDD